MKNKVSKTAKLSPPLEAGQVWECKDGRVLVGMVGKTLVHYKFYGVNDKRPPIQLTRLIALKRFLRIKRAVLRHEHVGHALKLGEKQLSFGRSLFNSSPLIPFENLYS